jgi:hypothetical protein
MWWKYLCISSYTRKPFLIYDFAPVRSHLNYPIYEENLVFFFISVSTSFSSVDSLFCLFSAYPLLFSHRAFLSFSDQSIVWSTFFLEVIFFIFWTGCGRNCWWVPYKRTPGEYLRTKKKHWHVIKRTTRDKNLGSSRYFYCSVLKILPILMYINRSVLNYTTVSKNLISVS